ncbi:MAG: alpha/beta hydrolase [Clostridia bacterium]|nr:alpha/beta hydrolase [Clostridia bacterium]
METYITTSDNVRLFCRVTGEGTPLLLIHGAMVDADFYLEIQQVLSKRMKVITYDRRGYTRSGYSADGFPLNGAEYSFLLERQAEDAAEVLRAFAYTDEDPVPAYVLGCSAGALTALKLIEKYPELVRHIYIHETPLVIFKECMNPKEAQWLKDVYDTVLAGSVRQAIYKFIFGAAQAQHDPRAKALPMEVVDHQMQNGNIYLKEEFPEGYLMEEDFFDYRALPADRITGLAGDSSPDGYCVKATKALMEKLGGRMFYIPGKHNAARELPNEFAAALYGFIELT